jgi:putative DNA primase/helicase
MTHDILEICRRCGRRPSRLAIVGDGRVWRLRCACGTRFEPIVGDSSEIGEPPPTPTVEDLGTLAFVSRLLAESRPAAGSLAERYLRSRGIGRVPPVLRFIPKLRHTPSDSWLPAMVAPVVNIDGELIGIHRTYLDASGNGKAAVEPNRMMLGHCVGGAVRLADVTSELGVGEGIESCLSAMEATGTPLWAALSTTGLVALVLPPKPIAANVTIYADNDAAGIAAARKAAARWYAEGRRVSIVRPRAQNADFNDAARGESA